MTRVVGLPTHLLTVALLCPGSVFALAGEEVEKVRSARTISEAVAFYNRLTQFPLPSPLLDEVGRLERGDVVRRIWNHHSDSLEKGVLDSARVVAFHLVEQPLPRVWLVLRDNHYLDRRRLTASVVSRGERGRLAQYQHLELPWPIADRHWVEESRPGLEVSEASAGLIWQLSWGLVEDGERIAATLLESGRAPGLDARAVRRAVYLTENTGAWTLFALGERRTLLAYQITLAPGGWIPYRWALQFAKREVRKLLLTVGLMPPKPKSITTRDTSAS